MVFLSSEPAVSIRDFQFEFDITLPILYVIYGWKKINYRLETYNFV